jgi:hypothetical protein
MRRVQAGHSTCRQAHLAGFCCKNSSFVMGGAPACGARQARQSMLAACRTSAMGASCNVGTGPSWAIQSTAAAAAAAAEGAVRTLLSNAIAMIAARTIRSEQYNRFVARVQRRLHAALGGMHTAAAVSECCTLHAPDDQDLCDQRVSTYAACNCKRIFERAWQMARLPCRWSRVEVRQHCEFAIDLPQSTLPPSCRILQASSAADPPLCPTVAARHQRAVMAAVGHAHVMTFCPASQRQQRNLCLSRLSQTLRPLSRSQCTVIRCPGADRPCCRHFWIAADECPCYMAVVIS